MVRTASASVNGEAFTPRSFRSPNSIAFFFNNTLPVSQCQHLDRTGSPVNIQYSESCIFGAIGAVAGFLLPRFADKGECPYMTELISPAAVTALASAIQTQEGYYPGSVAYTNNNPGNLVYVGQPGATQGANGFAVFSSYQAGETALRNQIMLDATRGTDANGNPTTTVSQLINSWAPPSENNTAAYIASVSAQTGYDPNAPLASLGPSSLWTPDVSTIGYSADDDDSGSGIVADLSSGVDLSSAGISASVPAYLIGAVVLGAAVLFSRR